MVKVVGKLRRDAGSSSAAVRARSPLAGAVVALAVACALMVMAGQAAGSSSEPRGLIAELRGDGVYLFEKDGSDGRRVVDLASGDSGIAWAPDGRSFVFAARQHPETGAELPGQRLFVADADGGAVAQLTFDWCRQGAIIGDLITGWRWADHTNCQTGDHLHPQVVYKHGRAWVLFEWVRLEPGLPQASEVWAMPLGAPLAKPGWVGNGRLPTAQVLEASQVVVEVPYRTGDTGSEPGLATIPWTETALDCGPGEDGHGQRIPLLWGPGCDNLPDGLDDLDAPEWGPAEPVVLLAGGDTPSVAPDGSTLMARTGCPASTRRAMTVGQLSSTGGVGAFVELGSGCDGLVFPPQTGAYNPDGQRILSDSRVYDAATGAELESLVQGDFFTGLFPGSGTGSFEARRRGQAWQCEPGTCIAPLRVQKAAADLDPGPSPATFTYSGDVSGQIVWFPDPFRPELPHFDAYVYGEVTIQEAQPDGWDLVSIDCGDAPATVALADARVTVEVVGATVCTFTSGGAGGTGPPPDPDPDPDPDPEECEPRFDSARAVARFAGEEDSELFSFEAFVPWCHTADEARVDPSDVSGVLIEQGEPRLLVGLLESRLSIMFAPGTVDVAVTPAPVPGAVDVAVSGSFDVCVDPVGYLANFVPAVGKNIAWNNLPPSALHRILYKSEGFWFATAHRIGLGDYGSFIRDEGEQLVEFLLGELVSGVLPTAPVCLATAWNVEWDFRLFPNGTAVPTLSASSGVALITTSEF